MGNTLSDIANMLSQDFNLAFGVTPKAPAQAAPTAAAAPPQDWGFATPAAAPTVGGSPLAAIMQGLFSTESSNNGNAVSPKGAQGIGQVMPATASATAKQHGFTYRPDLMVGNTPEALQYQKHMASTVFTDDLGLAHGDPVKALTIYHGGLTRRTTARSLRRILVRSLRLQA